MSKQCMNCGRPISGSGNNKIFCNDCFHLIASYLREIQSENEPAMTVFKRNRSRFRNSGINEQTERYIEKCCRKYDEKNGVTPAAAVSLPSDKPAAVEATPNDAPPAAPEMKSPGGDFDFADPFAQDFGAGNSPAPSAKSSEPKDERLTENAGYFIGDPFAVGESSGGTASDSYDPFAVSDAPASSAAGKDVRDFSTADFRAVIAQDAQMNAPSGQDDDMSAAFAAGLAAAALGGSGGDQPDDGTKMFEAVTPDQDSFAAAEAAADHFSGANSGAGDDSATVAMGVGAGFGAVGAGRSSGGGGGHRGGRNNDGYDDDDDGDGGDGDDGSRGRLMIILIAAIAAVILFAVLIANQFLGTRGDGSDTTTNGGTANGPAQTVDNATAPGTSDGQNPPSTDGVTDPGTEPPVTDPGTEPDTEPVEPDHEHEWLEATCTEPRTCSVGGETEGEPLGHSYGAGATCDAPAVCERCGESTGTALGHDWDEPRFTWTNSNRTATVTFTCKRDGTHTETLNASVTTATEPATCTVAGGTVHTASVTHNGITYSDKKVDDVSSPALGHAWGAPTFTWSSDNSSCTARFTCTRDRTHTSTQTASVTQTGKEATCETAGSMTYMATVNFDGETYGDSKTVARPATGHAWGKPEFTWSDDGTGCTAKVVCGNDSSHVEALDVTVEETDRTDPGDCTTEGSVTYTATATTPDGKTYTDKNEILTPAKGHTFEEGDLVCSVCGKALATMGSVGTTAYDDPYAGITVTVNEIRFGAVVGGERVYYVDYTLKYSHGDGSDQGKLYMLLDSGRLIEAEIDTSYSEELSADNPTVKHTVIFSMRSSERPRALEYHSAHYSGYSSSHSQMYSDNPKAALYWAIS